MQTLGQEIALYFSCDGELKEKIITLHNYERKVEYIECRNILYIFDFDPIQTESISHHYEKTISNFQINNLKEYIIFHYLDENSFFMKQIYLDQDGNMEEPFSCSIRYDDEKYNFKYRPKI